MAQAWQNNLYATPLLLLFLDTFGGDSEDGEGDGTEICNWDPETIQLSLRDIGVTLNKAAFSRLLVACDILTSDRFRQDAGMFIEYCNVLSGDILGSGMFDPADLDEIAWALTEASFISPEDEDYVYSPDIVGYVDKVIDDNGLMAIPPVLQISPDLVNRQAPGDFSDDPELFSAIFSTEEAKLQDLTDLLKDRTRTMLQQVKSLPLRHGKPEKVLSLLQQL